MQRNLTSSDVYGRIHEVDVETANAIATLTLRPAPATRSSYRSSTTTWFGSNQALSETCWTSAAGRPLSLAPLGDGPASKARSPPSTSVHIWSRSAAGTRRGRPAADRIEFKVGDVHSLDFGEGVFDAVIAHTLLSHVADPLTVLRQTKHLLAPEGRLVVFDGDYASLTFTTDDPDHGRASDEGIIGALVGHPCASCQDCWKQQAYD